MSFYEKSASTASGSDHRRKWDSVEYEIKAQERIAVEKDELHIKMGRKAMDVPKVKKEPLQARDYSLDLDSKVGKSIVINKTTASSECGGFYCKECDCVLKDSISYLDHNNGKNHQRNLGHSMTVKKDTLDDVRNRFAFNKKKIAQDKKRKQIDEMLEDVHEEEMKLMDVKKERKNDSPSKRIRGSEPKEESPDMDPELQAMMGFGGFAGAKNKSNFV